MASSSSDFPSTSASKEIIPDDEENTKQIQNTVNPKVNVMENGEKPASKSLSKDPINKKPPTFPNPFKPKAKKPKPKTPTIENSPNPEEEAMKKEEEAKKNEEEAKKKGEETEKEILAISKSIDADLFSIRKASERVEKHKKTFKEVTNKFKELKDVNANAQDFRKFKKVVKTLKQQISTQDEVDPKQEVADLALVSQLREISTVNTQVVNAAQERKMPNLFTDSDFERTLQFQDFKARYNELNFELKLCLLCFSVFPEDVEIKRRVMIYWWIGEEFVPPRKDRPEESSNQQHWSKFDLTEIIRKINSSESDSTLEHWADFYLDVLLKMGYSLESDLTPEHWANFYFDVLLKMGFIESVQKKPNPKMDVCKMHPFVRSMLNRIAQKAEFFEFDNGGTVNKKFSKSLRACLVHQGELPEDKKKEDKKKEERNEDKKKETGLLGKILACLVNGKKLTDLERIHAIFNVDEAILDSNLFNVDKAILDSKHKSLSNMRNANVLYLGRWQNLGTHHIEIDDTKILNAKSGNILDGLQTMKNLKFLSLQGISRITKLPKSILKLKNLTILDIRACHDLKKIPGDIGCLVNLTHLDMSECYLLDDMPKGISLLTKLQVLSGFVVVESKNKNSCTLEDLKGFCYLRKLSIRTGSDDFPTEKDLQALNQFKALNKLTIAWGRRSANTEGEKGKNKGRKKEGKDNNQTPKEDNYNKEGKRDKGKGIPEGAVTGEIMNAPEPGIQEAQEDDVFRSRGKTETSQESRKREKGKGILKGVATTDIVNAPEPGIREASTSRQEISVAQEAQPPEQKQGLSKKIGNLKKKLLRLAEHTPSGNSSLSQLTKLDLQCLPKKSPEWLRPEKLLALKKLYIRGGNLSDLGQFQGFSKDENGVVVGFDKRKWENVEELRLKYLDELDMEWRELLELFPKLDYLEKENCPRLSCFPCDEIGVWTKNKTIL